MPGLIATAKAAQPVWPVLSVAEQVESLANYVVRQSLVEEEAKALKYRKGSKGAEVNCACVEQLMNARKARLLNLMREATQPLVAREYAELLGVPQSIYKVREQIEELRADPANRVCAVVGKGKTTGRRAIVRYWVR
jgi:hypothetical protein